MNFVRQLSSKLLSTSTPTPSPSTPSTSDDSTVSVIDSVDSCTGCHHPCSTHPTLPSYLKIDQGSMAGSVKPHRRHLCVAQGVSATAWPNEVTDPSHSFIHLCSRLLDQMEGRIGYPVRLSAASEKTREEREEEGEEEAQGMDEEERAKRKKERDERREERADLYLYPDRLLFPGVSREALPGFLQAVFVEDKGRWKMKDQHGHIDAEEDIKQAGEEGAGAVEEKEEKALDLEFPYERLDGVSLLICAHKQRDKRCGIAGPMIKAEVDKEIQQRKAERERYEELVQGGQVDVPIPPPAYAPVHTLLISHTGGHKYAGNLIVYPGGVWYGRFNPCHVHVLLEGYATPAAATAKEQRDKLVPLKRGEVQLEW